MIVSQELSLGSAAPSFSTCKARYYRKQNYLQLELTVDFVTSNMRAAVRSCCNHR